MREVFSPRKLRIFTILSAVAAALALLFGCSSDTNSADNGQIAIPGFETLYLAANQTRQSVDFSNPKENVCLFRLSLTLDSGETLWTSGDLNPGEHVTALTLSRPLDAGEYAATLKYDCFSLTDKTPLNGAEIRLTLRMQ